MSDAAFDDLIRSIGELESTEFMEELGEHLAKEVEGLIERGFQTGTAPDGKAWAPRRLAKDRREPPHLPLRKSYDLHDGFKVRGDSRGIHVTNPVDYASYQNDGTRRGLTARPMVPPDGELQEWEEPLHDSALQFLASKLNRGG